ncbi:MAG: helix-turn-helix domain-containing protein [Pseudonocardiaceae bacterium]
MSAEGNWGIAVSYGHAQKLSGQQKLSGRMAQRPAIAGSPVDPALWWRADMRAALRARDIGMVYRLILDATGMSQYRLATLVGQAQSDVSEILKGRRVKDVAVLERIVDRLGIPRELIGLSAYGPDGTYCGVDPVADPPEGADDDMLRRHLLALSGVAAFSASIKGLGELTERVVGLSPVPLPERIFEIHVVKVRDLTQRLREAGRAYGSDPQVSSGAAAWATRLLRVPGSESVKRALLVAVAELHLVAGWAGFDAGYYGHATYHYSQGLKLATDAGNAYCQTVALNYAGLATIEHGHPNDGLKMLQCGQATVWKIPHSDDQDPGAAQFSPAALEASGRADSATALFALGEPEAASREQATARELWQPTRADPSGDLDIVAARLELTRGRLEAAEPYATASLRRWESGSARARTQSRIVLATVHVRAGERGGLALAHGAISDVTKLSSVRARRLLEPLAAALAARPGSDAQELARTARQVATTRA